MSTGKLVAKNFAFLSLAEVVTRVATMALGIVVLNILGKTPSGQLTFSFSFIAFFNIFADFGLTTLGMREIARNPKLTSKLAGSILAYQVLLSVALVAVLGLLMLTIPGLDGQTRLITFASGLTIIPAALNMSYVFQAYQRMKEIAVAKVIAQVVYVVVGLGLLLEVRQVIVLPVVQVITGLAGSLVIFYLLRRQALFRWEGVDWAHMRALVVPALPFVGAALLAEVYHNMDVVMVQFWRGSAEVGLYGAGYKIVNAILVVGGLVVGVYFPLISASFHQRATFVKQAKLLAQSMGLLAVPISVGGFLVARPLLQLLYLGLPAADISAAAAPYMILAWLPLVILLNVVLGNTLVAAEGQRQNLYSVAFGAALDVVLNIWLIPQYGLVGAAAATLVSEIAVGIYLLVMTRQMLGLSREMLGGYLLKPLLASLAMGLVVWWLMGIPALARIGLGGVVYLVVLWLLRGIPDEFMAMMRRQEVAAHE